MRKQKIVQIFVESELNDFGMEHTWYALADSGRIYRLRQGKWEEVDFVVDLPDLPEAKRKKC